MNLDYYKTINFGYSELDNTINSENFENIKHLIKESDIFNKDFFNNTILHWASRNNNLQILKFLMKNGADKIDINSKNSRGYTPLH